MRRALFLISSLLSAAPLAAQAPVARPAPAPAQPPAPAPVVVPPELSDPRVADQLGRVAGVLAKSLMNLPVGELEAAIEGRPPTPADRTRTVRDSVGDPYLDQRIAAEAAASGKTMQAATKAIVGSLPAIMKSLEGARAEIERATANLPDPTYPRR